MDDITKCRGCGLDPSQSLFDASQLLHNESLSLSPQEVAQGHAAVQMLGEKLKIIEHAMQRLDDLTTTLEKQLEKQIACLAPIHRIPDELLALVMQEACNVRGSSPARVVVFGPQL